MFKKLLSAILSISLIFTITVSAAAITTVEPGEPYVVSSSTYPQITDQEELLKLAVEQYKSKAANYSAVSSTETTDEQSDIMATQVLKEEVYSDGSVIQDVAITTIGLYDENGQEIGIQPLTTYFDTEYDVSGSLPGDIYYSAVVYATQSWPDGEDFLKPPVGRIRNIEFSTSSPGSSSMSRVIVEYIVKEKGTQKVHETKTYYPQKNTTYSYIPWDTNWHLLGEDSVDSYIGTGVYAGLQFYGSNGQYISKIVTIY